MLEARFQSKVSKQGSKQVSSTQGSRNSGDGRPHHTACRQADRNSYYRRQNRQEWFDFFQDDVRPSHHQVPAKFYFTLNPPEHSHEGSSRSRSPVRGSKSTRLVVFFNLGPSIMTKVKMLRTIHPDERNPFSSFFLSSR
jgi:hypothetical protein